MPDKLSHVEQAGRASKSAKPSLSRKIPVLAGLAALLSGMSTRQAAASMLLMTAGPVGAAGFVYEIKSMRRAQLEHEAADRVQYAAYLAAQANAANDRDLVTASINTSEDASTLNVKIEAMIRSRSVLLDTFGDDPSAVAPVYAVIIKQMLRDDEDAFTALAEKRKSASPDEAAKFASQEATLHDLHVKLAHLAKV